MLILRERDFISTELLIKPHDEIPEGNVYGGGTQYYLDEYRLKKNLPIAETIGRYTKAIRPDLLVAGVILVIVFFFVVREIGSLAISIH